MIDLRWIAMDCDGLIDVLVELRAINDDDDSINCCARFLDDDDVDTSVYAVEAVKFHLR